MDKNRSDIGSLVFRKEKLMAKYKELERIVSSAETEYLTLIKTPGGRFSRKLIRNLINELIGCVEEYRAYNEAEKAGASAKMEVKSLPKHERDFYEALFYVSLGLALVNDSTSNAWWYPSGTWGAVTTRVWNMRNTCRAEFHRDVINWTELNYIINDLPIRIPTEPFESLISAYHQVTENNLSELLSDDDRKEAIRTMTETERDYLSKEMKHPGALLTIEAEDHKALQEAADLMVPPPEDEDLSIEDIYDDLDDIPQYWDKEDYELWDKYFSDREYFTRSCRILLENYIEMQSEHDVSDEFDNAILLYLSRLGLAAWLDDDRYFTVYNYLDRVCKASAKSLGGNA